MLSCLLRLLRTHTTEHGLLRKPQLPPATRIPRKTQLQPVATNSLIRLITESIPCLVERMQPNGSLITLQTFQQKGLYNEIYGIPLGGKGHHPAHAVIEDAVKWLSAGGLTDPNQSSNLIPGGVKP